MDGWKFLKTSNIWITVPKRSSCNPQVFMGVKFCSDIISNIYQFLNKKIRNFGHYSNWIFQLKHNVQKCLWNWNVEFKYFLILLLISKNKYLLFLKKEAFIWKYILKNVFWPQSEAEYQVWCSAAPTASCPTAHLLKLHFSHEILKSWKHLKKSSTYVTHVLI